MKTLRILTFVLASLWSGFAAAQDPVDCSVQDHTALLQQMLDTQTVVSLPAGSHLCIRGNTGVNIPSDRTILGNGSTLQIKPGCAIPQVCKILQTRPLAERIRIMDLTLIGDRTPAIGFQILLRVDQATDVLVDHVRLINARSDGIQITGNTTAAGNVPSRNVVLRKVESTGSLRNGGSAVNADGLVILDSVFQDVSGVPIEPGAAFDFEPNGGGIVRRVTVLNSIFRRSRIGIYAQRGQGNPGDDYIFSGNTVEDNSLIGFVLNCVTRGYVADTSIVNSPLGLSSGGFVPPRPCLANDVVFARNTFSGSATPFRLVGHVRPIVVDNSAAPTQVAPGTGTAAVSGDTVFLRNAVTP